MIGWREWVTLPEFGIRAVKAKVDTGARTSALHAFDIRYVTRYGCQWVQFSIHPTQRSTRRVVHCEAPLVEERLIRDSGGKRTLRPVILTTISLYGQTFDVELTLVARDEMGFRMLIGRQALRGRFIVDPGHSFRAGLPARRRAGKSPPPAGRRTPAPKGGSVKRSS